MSRTGLEIAIIGIAGHYPKSASIDDFWRQVRGGEELVTFFTEEELRKRGVPAELVSHPRFVKAASYLEDMERFDAGFFGVPPKEAALLDPQHRHFLECAWEALEDAGYNPQQAPGRVGVYAGAAMDTYLLYNLMRNPVALASDPLQLQLANDKDYLTTRVSYKLNLRGPSHLVQSACSSSLVATHVACQALLNEECDIALVGGASVLVHTRNGYLHADGGVSSVDGHCRSFDADATGTILGSGVGCVVLKPLDRALEDGDHVYALILGTAINNDGSHKAGFAAPSMEGVSDVVLEALGNSGVEPESIGYVEAHGTATRLGDPIELQGLTKAWRKHTKKQQFCAIGSVKTNVGHLDAASGVTGLIKVALSLKDRVIPPNLHFKRPNPALELEKSPFFVNDRPRAWESTGGPRRAAVSSLGIGGTNAHVILEEAPPQEAAPSEPFQLLLLSARTPGALEHATDNLADRLEAQPGLHLADVAYTLQTGRRHFAHRRFAVVRDAEDALVALSAPERLPTREQASQRPTVAFLFSGQGSQYAGMAASLHRREPVFREHFDACSERVRALRGVDLRALVLGTEGAGADERLKATEWTQPALFAVEYALARLLMHWGIRPGVLMGHSIGEYVAACLAGVFSLADAVALVCERGRLMASMPPGAMTSVPLAEEDVLPLLGPELSLAAVNAPGRCVVAGPHAAVESLERRLEERGLKARRLQTSHAFHSAMMDPILEEFTRKVASVERKAPQVEIISNLTGKPLQSSEATDPAYWARHLRGAVRFSQGVAELLRKPDRLVLEVGPGNALTTFAMQHPERAPGVVVSPTLPHAMERERDVPVLLEAVGRAWQAGIDIDWKAFHGRARRRRVSLPPYPFERQRHWLEPSSAAGGGMLPGAGMPGSATEGTTASDSAAAASAEATEGRRPELATDYASPRTPVEQTLADIWARVLRLDRVGVNDNFFELGGHSLTATQVASRLRESLQVDLPLRELFSVPTVAELATYIEQRRTSARPALPPLTLSPRGEAPSPLSFAQHRLWFLDQFQPGSSAYNMPTALQLEGALDEAALRRAFDTLVQRHEALRTTFASLEGQAVQVIHPPAPVPLSVVELRSLPGDRGAQARRLALEEMGRPFDLGTGPLLRATLLRLDEQRHVLVLVMHHIVSDGWSMSVLVREMVQLYLAFRSGQSPSLPELPVQYADYSRWQHEWLRQGEELEKQLAYWKQQLSGAPPALELPTDLPRPAVQSFRGGSVSFHLPRPLSDAVSELARQQGATPFMVLLSAWYALLHRYSGQDDIVVGSPIAGRRATELEGLIGFFVNTLALRTQPGRAASFRALLTQVRDATLGAYAHQDIPFERLVEELQPGRDLGRTPLFQVMFALQNLPEPSMVLPELKLTLAADLDPGISKFDLELYLFPSEAGIHGTLTYNADLYAPATAERLAGHLRVLLDGALASPDSPLATLPLLPPAERLQVLRDFNSTHADFPSDSCIHSLVERQAAQRPDSVAVEFGERHLTYAQLDAQANQLAWHLRSLGIGPDVCVALCLERSLELVVTLLAILKAGGAYVPLEASYPAQRLEHMLEDSRAHVLLTTRALGATLPASHLSHVYVDEPTWTALPKSAPVTGVSARNLAYVVFTSGTTGRPKGVAVEHRSVQRLLHSPRYAHLGPDESFLLVSPVSFDASVLEVWGALAHGGRLAVFPPQSPSDLDLLSSVLQRHRVSTLYLSAGLFAQVVDLQLDALRGLRQLLTGGDVVSAPHVRRVLETLRVPVTDGYGPTEATVFTSSHRMEDVAQVGATIPIGSPLSNTQVYILDRHLQPVPVGVHGELFVGGPGVARGYLGRPDFTAERFVPDPFSDEPGARLYRTGDQARWRADGVLEFFGRLDSQVKLRGFRIELGEVESALRALPHVREAVAVVREDVPGDKRLVGYLVPDSGQTLDPAALRSSLQQRLPEYMVPSAFVPMEAFPLSPTGKVDRRVLPAPDASLLTRTYVAPATPAQQKLASLWAEVLRVERVGLHDDFFSLGGHSLLATQLMARIRSAFDVELPLRALFEAPTLEQLARRLDTAATGSSLPSLTPRPRGDAPPPLSFAQQRLWFLDQLQPGSAFYNLPAVLQLEGALDEAALRRAFGVLVHRHEALRTTFASHEDQAVQVIHPAAPVPVSVVDLRALPAGDRDAQARRLALEEMGRPFDLGTGPLLRSTLLRLDEQRHVLVLVMHHIISDGWSMGVLVREMAQLYLAFRSGQSPSLPELPVQYADYSLWQRERLVGGEVEKQLSFWKQQLAGAPSALELPTDFPRPPEQSFRGAIVPVHLSRDLSTAVNELARQQGATSFMVLLAAWSTLLHRYSGQDDLVVGSPIAGRRHSELEGLIGFFVNTLVLRTLPGQAASFRELLAQVRDTTLGAYAHQDVPFERLVEELQPVRDLGRSPLFQVFFALQNAPSPTLALPGLKLTPVDLDPGTSKFDLELSLVPSPDGFHGTLTYSTDLFSPATAERLAGHLRVLLEGALASPDSPLASLPLLSPAERLQVLRDFNSTHADFPADSCLHFLVERQAALRPDSVAVEFGDSRLTYAQLDSQANQLAWHLRSLGVGPDVCVALCLERSLELVVALLAILRAGGAYVPLDASYPAQRLQHMLADSRARVLLTTRALGGTLPASHLPHVYVDEPTWTALPTSAPVTGVSSRNLAYVVFTSGTTGRPKGVAVEHRSVLRLLHSPRYAHLGPDESFLLIAPVSFDASVLELWGPLAHGGRLVVFPPQSPSDLGLLSSVLHRHHVSTLHLTSGLFSQVVDLQPDALRGVRQLLTGGDVVSAPHVRRVLETLRIPVTACYGPTEATLFTSSHRMTDAALVGASIPIGSPISNTQVYVLDRHLQPTPVGVPGELFIGGPGVARGYLGRPDLSAERFVPDSFGDVPGSRLYRTGDQARWRADGVLEFLGRIDSQVKLRGFRIELGEVESALRTLPHVREAVAVVREDSPGDKRLVGYLVAHSGQVLDTAALRSTLQQRLPEYMVPSALVLLEALPLTSNAKTDRKALPAPDTSLLAREYIAPTTATQQRLASLWAEVLRVERIGLHDNFFALGGHSLLATQLMSRLRSGFGVELPLRALFEAPTLERLSFRVDAALKANRRQARPPLRPASRDEELPLSFAQQRLWFLDQLQPGAATYNIPMALQVDGPLDAAVLERAFSELVRRHESLRTTFRDVSGDPVQVLHPPAPFTVPVVDLSSHASPEPEVDRLTRAEAARPFDLARGPLLRATLLRLSAAHHVLLLTLHHIVADGWSMGVMVRDLGELYRADREGRPSVLPVLPVQYADYSVWQRQWLRGEVLQRELEWWRGQLSGAPAALELPTDRPRPAVQTSRGAAVPVMLPRALGEAVKDLAQRNGATHFMVLLAAWQLLLSRYADQDDVSVGSPIANRNHAETEGLVGFFVNTLVLRTRIDTRASFRELLAHVRASTLAAYEHQDVPFEKLVEELQPQRDPSRGPLFQVMFVLQNAPLAPLALPGVTLSPVAVEDGTVKFDLDFSLEERDGGFAGRLGYNIDLFDEATISKMARHFVALVESVVSDAERPVSGVNLLSEAERHQVLVEWNPSGTAPTGEEAAHRLFEAQVERTPDAAAVVTGMQRLTYRELDTRANRLAWHLRSLGVGPDVPVAVCLERTAEMVVALLGVLKAGGTYVPLNPAYPLPRLAFMLQDCAAPVLLTQSHLRAALPAYDGQVLELGAEAASPSRWPTTAPASRTSPDSLAYVIYTSGSTGQPKGVMVPHRGLPNLARAQARAMGVEPGTRVLQFASPAFDAAISEVFVTLLSGGTLCLASREDLMPGAPLARLLREQQIHVATLLPSALAVLEPAGLEGLRTIISAGEACSAELVAKWAPGRRFINAYGPTEATVCATLTVCTADGRKPSIGRALDNVRVYVLDANLRPVPPGVAGELFIGGVGVARGYLRRPDLTAERFVPDAFSDVPGERMYRSGDRVRWRNDGTLEYLGRTDFQMKLRGFRIEPGEIEAVLAQHPAVKQALVLVREDLPGDPRLVAWFTSRAQAPDADTLRAFLKERLPEYMVPSAFVPLEAFPLSPNGKVDRKALPAPDASLLARSFVAPVMPTEKRLASLWAEVLRVGRVGLHDDFFSLGGHSLLATQLMARIRSAFDVELPLRALFEAPTLEQLARRIDAATTGSSLPLLIARSQGDAPSPLSFAQQRLWFLDQLQPGSASYNLPSVLQLEGALDEAALRRAFDTLVQRHGVLRTTFASHEGQAVQVIHPPAPVPLPVVDLRALPAGDRDAQARRLALEAMDRPFDLGTGPLLRATLLRLDEQRHVLVLVMHHIISDGWSMNVLVREMGQLYLAFRSGQAPSLPELPVQYADYSLWQREWLRQGDEMEKQLDYWKQQLAGVPSALELPTDFPRPAVQSFRGRSLAVHLPRSLSVAVNELARQQGATAFMVLLAAWSALLQRYSGQDDVVVGSPIAGRRATELEGLIGFFVNTLALRTRLDGSPSFRMLIDRVRETTLGAFAHQDIPFERLVEELQPVRNLGRTPLFQVFFALQNAPQEAQELPGLTLNPVAGLDPGVSKFDLELSFFPSPEGFHGTLAFSTDLFSAATAERMAGHLRVLLEGALASPDAPLASLPLLPHAERLQVLRDFNATLADFPADDCLHTRVEHQAALRPDSVAVEFGDARLTYAQLDAQANQLAHHLRSLGVGPDVRVALCLDRSLELVVSLLAILKAGGAYVPLEASYPAQRLQHMLEDSRAQVLLSTRALGGTLPASHLPQVYVDEPTWTALPTSAPVTAVSSHNLAYVVFTSGTTGRPKGVAVEHHSVMRLLHAPRYAHLGPDETFLLVSPVSFDGSVLEIWAPLVHGGRLVVFPPQSPSDLGLLASVLHRHNVSTLHLTSGLFAQVVDLQPDALRGLRQLLTGGDVVSPPHVRKVIQTLRIPVTACYGPTEVTVFTSTHRMTDAALVGASIPIGAPLSNTQVYILDRHLQPTPVGVPGELFVGGPGVARGYLGRPDLSAERFVPDSFGDVPGSRLYRTGDQARWRADGVLEFLGRLDSQVKLRGFRIELGEVEAALRDLPHVREAVAVVREDSPGDKRLVGYLVPHSGQVLDPAALRATLQQRLPEYMVPSALVLLEALPLTANAKTDRKALPAPDASLLAHEYVAPATPTQQRLASLWAEVLRVERVGLHDDFFSLGGHSLLATQLMARIRSAFNTELPLRALFEAPTLEQLARRIDATATGFVLPPLHPAPRDEAPPPLSFAQQRLWFIEQLQPGSSAYSMPGALRLEGPLDASALERAFSELVRRHESLRTTLREQGGAAYQHIAPPAPIHLPVVDLTPHTEPEAEARRLTLEDAQRPFDLAAGPLLRTLLLRLSAQRHVLLLNLHHAISDGWSMGVLVREVAVLYEAFRQGLPSPLPELPVQYADYAVWQRSWLKDDVLARQVQWWKQQLSGAPHALELQTDFPRPPVQSFRGGAVHFLLSPALTRALESFSQKEGATLFMALLASTHALLSRYSGQDDVVIGSPIAGRRVSELEGLIGFFVNTLALRARLGDAPSFRTLLGRVRETTLGAFAHQDVPFEKLVEELHPQRDLSRSPFFQVMLVLQNTPTADLSASSRDTLSIQPVEVEDPSAKFDLGFTFGASPEGLRGSITYCADLFREETVRQLATHFQRLLEAALQAPEAPLPTLPLLTPEERHLLLVELNDTRTVLRRSSIHQLFEAQASRTPEATALISGDVRLTYRELDTRANRLARHLRSLGVGPEARVAVCLERSETLLVSLLAILKAGGAYVPLDPAYPRERLDFTLVASGACLLLSQQELLDSLHLETAGLPTLCFDSRSDAFGRLPSMALAPLATEENLAYVIYTSGSTGRPKGVAITHASATAFLDWATRTFSPAQLAGTLAATSICFDLSVFELFAPLACGGTVILARDALALPSAAEVTLINTVPSAIAELLRLRALPAAARTVNLAGEPLPGSLARALYATGTVEHVFNLYGPTEDTTYSTFTRVENGPGEPTIGMPLPETSAYVLDVHGQLQPPGVPGELFLAGAGLARGYLGRPDLTAERFVPDPFSSTPGARMYRTGDLARRLANGTLEYLGRMDFQVKVRGFRIELGEVESTLRDHPSVQGAVVLARQEASGDKRLVGYVLPSEGHTPDAESLRQHLRTRLPEYMVPSAFVVLEAFPLTPNGKVDRKALPAPDASLAASAAYVAPRDSLELELALLWEELLGVRPVGATSHFFELGGHSLLAVRLMASLRERLGRALPLSALFQAPTVEGLSRLLRQVPGPFSPLVPIQRDGDRRPFFCVHPIGGNVLCYAELSRLLGPAQPFYGLQAQGLDGQQPPLSRIEDMAARYLEALRAVQPAGPYQLGGWSFGGVVAFEMARQLRQQGEEVELLALIDPTPVGADWGGLDVEDAAQVAALFVQDHSRLAGEEAWMPQPGERDAVLRELLERGHQTGLFPAELGLEQLRPLFDVFASNLRAVRAYQHQPHDGRLVVLRASEGQGRAPDLGWAALATKGVELIDVPGDHYSALRAPHVQRLAELLARCIEEAQGPSRKERPLSA